VVSGTVDHGSSQTLTANTFFRYAMACYGICDGMLWHMHVMAYAMAWHVPWHK